MEYAKFKDVIFSVVTEESITLKNNIASEPVENGEEFSDHVKSDPLPVSITGFIVGDGAEEKFNKLNSYGKDGVVDTYIGRVILTNCVIETFKSTRNKSVSNGYSFDLTLRQVNIGNFETSNKLVNPSSKVIAAMFKDKTKKTKQAKKKKTKETALQKILKRT